MKKSNTKIMRSFRFQSDTIKVLNELKKYVNQHSPIEINATHIIELLIQDAATP